MWVLPGGGVDEGETSAMAAQREVLEESGLHIHSIKLLAQYSPINKLARETALYSALAEDGLLCKNDESCDAAFFRFEEFPDNTFYIHRNWIDEVLKSTQIIQRPLNEVTYTNLLKYFLRHPLTFLRYLMSWLGVPLNS